MFSQINKEIIFYTDSSNYDVKYYKLNIYASTDSLYLAGNTEILATAEQPDFNKFYIELSASLNVDSVVINNVQVTFSRSENWIKASLPTAVSKGTQFSARIYYKGNPSTQSQNGGIALDSYEGVKVLYTLSEPFSSNDFFACKQHLTDKADSVAIILNVPNGLTGVANGLLTSVDTLPGNLVSFHWESRYPTAYYLIAIAVSDFKEYSY
ncbi:MAG: hypothetical protein M1308_07395, partial [Actinobacteria bacterium]|nr:hypothetical protein [Actinomycetota bacterium]